MENCDIEDPRCNTCGENPCDCLVCDRCGDLTEDCECERCDECGERTDECVCDDEGCAE